MGATSRVLAGSSLVTWVISVVAPLTSNEIAGSTRLADWIANRPELIPVLALPPVLAIALIITRRSVGIAWFALVVGVLFAAAIIMLPMGVVLWDGADAQGRPTGGMVEDHRSIGWFTILGGALLLAVAALLRVAQRRSSP